MSPYYGLVTVETEERFYPGVFVTLVKHWKNTYRYDFSECKHLK